MFKYYRLLSQCLSLMVKFIHHLSLIYMATPPPRCLEVRSRSFITRLKLSTVTSESLCFGQVCVRHIKEESLYSELKLQRAVSSSVLFRMDLTLPKSMVGSGLLRPLNLVLTRMPVRFPRFRFGTHRRELTSSRISVTLTSRFML